MTDSTEEYRVRESRLSAERRRWICGTAAIPVLMLVTMTLFIVDDPINNLCHVPVRVISAVPPGEVFHSDQGFGKEMVWTSGSAVIEFANGTRKTMSGGVSRDCRSGGQGVAAVHIGKLWKRVISAYSLMCDLPKLDEGDSHGDPLTPAFTFVGGHWWRRMDILFYISGAPEPGGAPLGSVVRMDDGFQEHGGEWQAMVWPSDIAYFKTEGGARKYIETLVKIKGAR